LNYWCFTGTIVQILPQKALRADRLVMHEEQLVFTSCIRLCEITCFTGTTVQILTQKAFFFFARLVPHEEQLVLASCIRLYEMEIVKKEKNSSVNTK
jgi:hypothetical protein